MFKTLKFKGNEENFWFLSDLHHNHDRGFLYSKRNYKNISEHDEGIINNWNKVCTHNSVIFNLGDVQFGDPDGSKFLQLMRRLNFDTQYIYIGNHVSGHLQVYKNEMLKQFPNSIKDGVLQYEVYPLTMILDGIKKIIFMPQYSEIQINGQFIVLCHYSIYSFNNQARGSLMLSGHSHSSCPLTNKNTGKGKRLDLSWESFGRPVNLLEIKKLLANRDLDCSDHHGQIQIV